MRILIVEDEEPIARYIRNVISEILRGRSHQIRILGMLQNAMDYIQEHPIDICILDLNLNGEDGFELLRTVVAESFHTIIISANTDRAIEAFEYGVLDFVPKPFSKRRLQQALDRFMANSGPAIAQTIKYLSCRKDNKIHVIQVDEALYFHAAGSYVEVFLTEDHSELLNKSMDYLEKYLPSRFIRVHRSFIVDSELVEQFYHQGGGTYALKLQTGREIPVSRNKIKEIQKLFDR